MLFSILFVSLFVLSLFLYSFLLMLLLLYTAFPSRFLLLIYIKKGSSSPFFLFWSFVLNCISLVILRGFFGYTYHFLFFIDINTCKIIMMKKYWLIDLFINWLSDKNESCIGQLFMRSLNHAVLKMTSLSWWLPLIKRCT